MLTPAPEHKVGVRIDKPRRDKPSARVRGAVRLGYCALTHLGYKLAVRQDPCVMQNADVALSLARQRSLALGSGKLAYVEDYVRHSIPFVSESSTHHGAV